MSIPEALRARVEAIAAARGIELAEAAWLVLRLGFAALEREQPK